MVGRLGRRASESGRQQRSDRRQRDQPTSARIGATTWTWDPPNHFVNSPEGGPQRITLELSTRLRSPA